MPHLAVLSMNDVPTQFSVISTALGIVASGFAACWSFCQKALETSRARRQARQMEILRLQDSFKEVQHVFSRNFDYNSQLDDHLRIVNLVFDSVEVTTRTQVDQAFEHLRDVHRSVTLDLIEASDIGPWVYWIHIAGTRPPIQKYAQACGYGAFMDDLTHWANGTNELKQLKLHCPWLDGGN